MQKVSKGIITSLKLEHKTVPEKNGQWSDKIYIVKVLVFFLVFQKQCEAPPLNQQVYTMPPSCRVLYWPLGDRNDPEIRIDPPPHQGAAADAPLHEYGMCSSVFVEHLPRALLQMVHCMNKRRLLGF